MSIKIENVVTPSFEQWKAVIRGMRNPMNSWDKSDSGMALKDDVEERNRIGEPDLNGYVGYIGKNDLKLMRSLAKAGSDHRKFLRMIPVHVDIVAPLYWWKEFDTYKVGTVANSCSTMHKVQAKEFEIEDFSFEHVLDCQYIFRAVEHVLNALNRARDAFLKTKDKSDWWKMIQLLPSSFNQRRTVFLNYEVLRSMNRLGRRRDHKLDEWREFCAWVDGLPYYKEIFGMGEE